jgi:hypothetical protein
VSALPPGGKGITSVMGRLGYPSCAQTGVAPTVAARAAIVITTETVRRWLVEAVWEMGFMVDSGWGDAIDENAVPCSNGNLKNFSLR